MRHVELAPFGPTNVSTETHVAGLADEGVLRSKAPFPEATAGEAHADA
jgi:hypothetical protein